MDGQFALGRNSLKVEACEKTRVLMFCPQFAPIIGGAERQAEKLGKSLLDRGIDVRVLTPIIDPTSPMEESMNGLPVRRFRMLNLSAKLPGVRGIGLINAPSLALQVMWQVWRAAGQADVVHCHIGSLQSVAAAWAARLRGVPVICKAAVADERSDLGEAARAGLTGRFVAWAGRRAFTYWVATTEAVKEALRRAGVDEARIVVIPNGVELSALQLQPRPGPVRRFLYLGRLSTNIHRDTPSLISAFDRLAGVFEDAELVLVGGGDLLNETKALAAVSKHADRIVVLGPASAGEWLAWADCFVLPSRREGLSNALLEAMAAGLPCIANGIPPNREVLEGGDAGILSEPENVKSLYEAMLRLAADKKLADSLAAAARLRVESRYAITAVAASYEELYAGLGCRRVGAKAG